MHKYEITGEYIKEYEGDVFCIYYSLNKKSGVATVYYVTTSSMIDADNSAVRHIGSFRKNLKGGKFFPCGIPSDCVVENSIFNHGYETDDYCVRYYVGLGFIDGLMDNFKEYDKAREFVKKLGVVKDDVTHYRNVLNSELVHQFIEYMESTL